MKATLRSNRGSESVSFRFRGRNNCGPEPGVDCEIRVAGSSWKDGEAKPVRADLGVLHLSLIQLGTLIGSVSSWLTLPLEELARRPLQSACSLSFSPPERLGVDFGPRRDTVNAGKPVVTVSWQLGSFRGELHYVTDPSCLGEFTEELRAMLAEYGYDYVDGRLTEICS